MVSNFAKNRCYPPIAQDLKDRSLNQIASTLHP